MECEALALSEKFNFAEARAREIEAGKHFFDLGLPNWRPGFSVFNRNPGHWDVTANEVPGRASAWRAAHPGGSTSAQDGESERAFRIRGENGVVDVYDERWDPHRPHPRGIISFRSIGAAMLWISEELMQEKRGGA